MWAGIFAGLAAATKYNLALMLLPLVAACVIRRPPAPNNRAQAGEEPNPAIRMAVPSLGGKGGEPPANRDRTSGSPIIGGVVGLLAFVFAFFAACPGAILERQTFLHDLRFEAIHVQNVDDPTFRDTGNGFVYHVARNLDAGLGLPLLLLSLVSVGYALYRRERGDGLLAAFALPYYVLIGLAAVRYARYDIPLLPILALWNGRLAAVWSHNINWARRDSGILAYAGTVVITLFYGIPILGQMDIADPRDQAYIWLRENASASATIGFAVQPWFGTVPISPVFFALPRPGAWREATSARSAKTYCLCRAKIGMRVHC